MNREIKSLRKYSFLFFHIWIHFCRCGSFPARENHSNRSHVTTVQSTKRVLDVAHSPQLVTPPTSSCTYKYQVIKMKVIGSIVVWRYYANWMINFKHGDCLNKRGPYMVKYSLLRIFMSYTSWFAPCLCLCIYMLCYFIFNVSSDWSTV